MTQIRRKDTHPAITIHQAFEHLRVETTARDTGGDMNAGWARLQKSLDAIDREAKGPQNRRRKPSAKLLRLPGYARRLVRAIPSMETVAISALVTVTLALFWFGGYWPTLVLPIAVVYWFAWWVKYQDRMLDQRDEDVRRESERIRRRHRQAAVREADQRVETVLRQAKDRCRSATSSPGPVVWKVSLFEANLIGVSLPDTNFEGCHLRNANLYSADLSGANLFGADLAQAELTSADLSRADLTNASLVGARLAGTDLSWARLSGANMSAAVLGRADLTGADLTGAMLAGADLSGADLTGAILVGAHLSRVHMHGTNLAGATLHRANFRHSYLYRTNLSRADLRDANLTGAVLTHAVLIDTDLTGADLSDVKDMREVTWSKRTRWGQYYPDVLQRSIPLGRGRFKLNPPDDTALGYQSQPPTRSGTPSGRRQGYCGSSSAAT
ncbi:pentapeptide repeat-containing protein [Nocardia wallacei]|uniref:pentapeptide repeat-containing protein n=1 Tax=Nocardia wallacei TaxID=480035 RepID=UPI00245509B8|nr:pentapeptide repeat-containing protein [Nocardia wallacei]